MAVQNLVHQVSAHKILYRVGYTSITSTVQSKYPLGGISGEASDISRCTRRTPRVGKLSGTGWISPVCCCCCFSFNMALSQPASFEQYASSSSVAFQNGLKGYP